MVRFVAFFLLVARLLPNRACSFASRRHRQSKTCRILAALALVCRRRGAHGQIDIRGPAPEGELAFGSLFHQDVPESVPAFAASNLAALIQKHIGPLGRRQQHRIRRL